MNSIYCESVQLQNQKKKIKLKLKSIRSDLYYILFSIDFSVEIFLKKKKNTDFFFVYRGFLILVHKVF